MKMKDESSFLQGVESRLDSLFAEDDQPIREKDSDPSPATVQEVATDTPPEAIEEVTADSPQAAVMEEVTDDFPKVTTEEIAADSSPEAIEEIAFDIKDDVREIPDIQEETSHKLKVSSDPGETQDKSTFISEIEKRFSAIFGEEKNVDAVNMGAAKVDAVKEDTVNEDTVKEDTVKEDTAKDSSVPDDLRELIAQAEPEKIDTPAQSFVDLSSTSSSILQSPLKDMKSIVLSIEWEINDHILEQLEDEINKLYLLYTGDRIIQGFLRIIRFLGRYVRVRGVYSNQDSISLLLSVYDHLESVMVAEGMTEAKKHIILIDNIKKYRTWVESTDLATSEETQVSEIEVHEVESPVVEPPEDQSFEDQKEDMKPSASMDIAKEEPIAEDKAVADELSLQEPEEFKIELAMEEPEAVVRTQPLGEDMIDKAFAEERHRLESEEDKSGLAMEEPEAVVRTQPLGEDMIDKAFAEERHRLESEEDKSGLAMEEPEAVVRTQPLGDRMTDKVVADESFLREPEDVELGIKEPEIPAQPQPAPMAETSLFGRSEEVENAIEAIKDLPPHEAFVYALEEIKKNFQSELDMLKEEIRLLKSAR